MDKISFEPYKCLGLCLDNKSQSLFNAGNKSFLACSTKSSYKVYSIPELKVKILGIPGPSNVVAISGYNSLAFVAYQNEIIAFENHHAVKKFNLPLKSKISAILPTGKFLLVGTENGYFFSFDIGTSELLLKGRKQGEIIKIIHPFTYLNKVLLIGTNFIELFNISTGTTIYNFQETIGNLIRTKHLEIISACSSPVLDIIAISFTNGNFIILNIRSDEILFELKLSSDIRTITFSKAQLPLMALGDVEGRIHIYSLNEKKCLSTISEQFHEEINLLEFIGDSLNLLVGSGKSNVIKILAYDESELNLYYLLRERRGPQESISRLRFYNEKHLLLSTSNKEAEIWDISMLNESMNSKFSLKQKSSNNKAESLFRLNTVKDFASASNRELDWGNVICSHLMNSKATIWNTENKSIIKKSLQLTEANDSCLNKVFLTNCGNFAIVGYENGLISKVNIQSGDHQVTFNKKLLTHKKAIIGIFVDSLNKYLVSCDDETLAIWDFYSGLFIKKVTFERNATITLLRSQPLSNLFLLAYSDGQLELFTIEGLIKSRVFFLKDSITDCVLSGDNKFVIVSTTKMNLYVYNVLSGACISNLKFNAIIISMDLSSDLSTLAVVFDGDRHISLLNNCIYQCSWTNKEKCVSFSANLEIKGLDRRSTLNLASVKETQVVQTEEWSKLDVSRIPIDKEKITYTDIPMGKWISLLHWESIKTKNTPQIKDTQEFKVPFFLDFDNVEKLKKEVQGQKVEFLKQKSKIFKNETDKYLSELGCELEIMFERFDEIDKLEILEALKKKTPAQIDYEMRKILFGNPTAIRKTLLLFDELLNSKSDFDLIQIYVANFLTVNILFNLAFS